MKKIFLLTALTVVIGVLVIGTSYMKNNKALPETIESAPQAAAPVDKNQASQKTYPDSNNTSTVSSQTISEDQNANANLDTTKRGWGLGKSTDQYGRPADCINFNAKYGKYNALAINEASENIILTFDEGYENGFTGTILDTLKQKQVQAIFFITYDYAKNQPELIKRMIDEGHVIENHSYKHKSMPELDIQAQKTEITTLHDYMKQTYNYEMSLFRPPMGEFSEQSLDTTHSLGYKTMLWSFAYLDYLVDKQPNISEALEKITSRTHPGAIYLLHAVSKTNNDVLGQVIDQIRSKGFEFGLIE